MVVPKGFVVPTPDMPGIRDDIIWPHLSTSEESVTTTPCCPR